MFNVQAEGKLDETLSRVRIPLHPLRSSDSMEQTARTGELKSSREEGVLTFTCAVPGGIREMTISVFSILCLPGPRAKNRGLNPKYPRLAPPLPGYESMGQLLTFFEPQFLHL